MTASDKDIAHFAWCGLIALGLARSDGVVKSTIQENIFLCRWLAAARKKRLFCRELAEDINWLLNEGQTQGERANLSGKLAYLWRANRGNLLEEDDLFRIRHALHAMSLTGIRSGILNDQQWHSCIKTGTKTSVFFIKETDLAECFGEDGVQLKSLIAIVTASITATDALLSRSGWVLKTKETSRCLYALHSSVFR
ncbi:MULTISPECIES: DUF2913 family protein [Pantoea]|uniref:DUF2913 family protein n=1 Tax=Pantoea TaxID=53335 RepID=UPI000DE4F38A|nr:DUF2913 family protein [Pantoea sp. 3_1284]RBO13681.1 hypothetical protein DSL62_07070 [Pantoea sp. 3_1284]